MSKDKVFVCVIDRARNEPGTGVSSRPAMNTFKMLLIRIASH